MASGKKFWKAFESGIEVDSNPFSNGNITEKEFNSGVWPDVDYPNYCRKCAGCCQQSGLPSPPVFKKVGNQIFSDGGSCWKPFVLSIKKGKNKIVRWEKTSFLKEGKLIRV